VSGAQIHLKELLDFSQLEECLSLLQKKGWLVVFIRPQMMVVFIRRDGWLDCVLFYYLRRIR
jgi:hypothetical protein